MSWRLAAASQLVFLTFTTVASIAMVLPMPGQPAVPLEQIVDRMQQHEANQWKELKHYEAVRHYQVQYKGFGTHLAGMMDVDLNYDSGTGKRFRIISQSGSKLLCDKVLKRAVESEEEASKDRSTTALNRENYRFKLVGNEMVDGREAYILRVDPLRKSKFLYRGKVWVDAAEYAVMKIEVEPAQNPSFWITSTQIENTNLKTDGVWLPEKNRSESKIRIGGSAVLTINYGTYHIVLAGPPQVAKRGVSVDGTDVRGAAF